MRAIWCSTLIVAVLAASNVGCGALQNPPVEPFYGRGAPPAAQELRWSNGASLPKSFDPARAAAAPETDVARAIFEGLTDLNPKTLQPVPALAARWESSEDFRTWTFYLHQSARWSNGKTITAKDFAGSWRRAATLGEAAPHHRLLTNIVGAKQVQSSKLKVQSPAGESNVSGAESEMPPTESQKAAADTLIAEENERNSDNESKIQNPKSKIQNPFWFGVEAAGDFVLRVYLSEPDKDFPALVAHPIFRPVWSDGADLQTIETPGRVVANGAFRPVGADADGLTLERNKNYRDAHNVRLERVRFVPKSTAESALAAYRGGELDAVTNANFEPLAAKLLASYQDFRRTPFNAVTFYEFNTARQPFTDKRVRQALALSIDRDRLTQDEMDGAGTAASGFLPHRASGDGGGKITYDPEQARKLLGEAGFENGKDFPKIRLLINRNDLQRRLARMVAQMWQKNLNVEIEIVVKNQTEYEATIARRDFDLARRGVVLPTTDETANLAMLFGRNEPSLAAVAETEIAPEPTPSPVAAATVAPQSSDNPPETVGSIDSAEIAERRRNDNPAQLESAEAESNAAENLSGDGNQFDKLFLTEAEAVAELPAIPLYFPSSNVLIKPYVAGFEPNLLDAPSLKNVRIETDWRQNN